MNLEGIAELPLHGGHVPPWMLRLMKKMSSAILEIMIEEHGPRGVLKRLSDPLWFQCLNNIIGMDWDSSGSTTVTLGILREVTWEKNLGILILGGKGRRARRVPEEIPVACKKLGLGEDHARLLERASRIAAKVDSSLIQAGYTLYHHALIVTEDGFWGIVQQGMNTQVKLARRYHWLSPRNLVVEPHSVVAGRRHSQVLNLTARESEEARKAIVDAASENLLEVKKLLYAARRAEKRVASLSRWLGVKEEPAPPVIYRPVPSPETIEPVLKKLREINPRSVEELLLVRGVGPATVRALALVADLIYNAKPSTRDPVNAPLNPLTYAYAVGGKDGIPYPYNPKTAKKVIEVLEDIINRARIGEKEKRNALRRLAALTLKLRIQP